MKVIVRLQSPRPNERQHNAIRFVCRDELMAQRRRPTNWLFGEDKLTLQQQQQRKKTDNYFSEKNCFDCH